MGKRAVPLPPYIVGKLGVPLLGYAQPLILCCLLELTHTVVLSGFTVCS